jgi:hypothetical protein
MRDKARGLRARPYASGSDVAKLNTQGVRGVLGVLLADGCLVRSRTPTKERITAAMHGGESERSFLEEKAEEIRRWVPTTARITPYRTRQRESGLSTTVLRFRFTSDKLLLIYNLLYPCGEREITSPALEVLDARAAAWLWAEGARPFSDQGILLRRVGQTEGEARIVSSWLESLTGATSTAMYPRLKAGRSRGSPRLLFEPEQAKRLQEALRPHAPSSRAHMFAPDWQ